MVIINGVSYEVKVSYSDTLFSMIWATDKGYGEIEQLFGGNPTITVQENDEVVVKFYSRGLNSIAINSGEATINFSVSVFDGDVQTQVLSDISDLKEESETQAGEIDNLNSTTGTHTTEISELDSTTTAHTENLSEDGDALTELADIYVDLEARVKALEEKEA